MTDRSSITRNNKWPSGFRVFENQRLEEVKAAIAPIYRQAIEFTLRAGRYAYRDRRQKKRHFRTLWITRLSAAVRARGIPYNRFIPALVAAGIELNRKMLSELAISDPAAFDAIVEMARPHLNAASPAAA